MGHHNRRDFIKNSAAGIAVTAAGLIPRQIESAGNTGFERIRYRDLGSTGCKVSEIGFGVLHTQDTAILHAAIDSGINYFDTAHGYQNGACEETLGKVMKTRRNEIFLVTKVSTGTIDTMRQKIEISLKRLQTDCVDLLLVHGPGKREQILNQDIMKLYDDMRQSGKTRFVGFSTHNQVEGLEVAIESGFWQAVSLPYNYFSPPEVIQAIKKARNAGIAITAMKALITVKRPRKPFPDIREGKTKQITNQQALLRWVLNDNNVDTVIPGIASFEQLADDTAVMGTKLSIDDREIIRRYTEGIMHLYCRGLAGCDGCRYQCPYGVDIQELNRCVNYAYGYGDTGLARDNHAHLPKSSQVSRCDSCDDCAVTCVNGLDLSKTVRLARALFT